jgi:hypothetical protein
VGRTLGGLVPDGLFGVADGDHAGNRAEQADASDGADRACQRRCWLVTEAVQTM